MSFNDKETSRQGGEPVRLYLVRYGAAAGNVFPMTNHDEPVVYGGLTYIPVAGISHTSVKRSLELGGAGLTITLPSSHPLAIRWRTWPPSEVISCTIRQGHLDEPEFKVYWLGRLLGHKDNMDGTADFEGEPRTTSLQRPGLSRNYQRGCHHVLYSQGDFLCNADKEAATSEFQAVAADGPLLTLSSGWNALGDARLDYITGIVEWSAPGDRYEVRSILAIQGSTGVITLDGPTLDLQIGTTVKVILGCNHLPYLPEGDCERLHNNAVNFGGQSLIPLDNPIGLKNVFY